MVQTLPRQSWISWRWCENLKAMHINGQWIAEQVKGKIIANYWITVMEVTEEVSNSYGSCKAIDTLDIRQVAVKFVPELLNFQQKLHQQMKTQHCSIIIGDQSYGYDIKIKP